jgi:hypothetical protein
MTRAQTPTLADPDQAQAHFRALIDRGQLASASALVVCCDAEGRPTSHWHVVGCDPDAAPSECTAVLQELLNRSEQGPSVRGLALGLTRPGGEEVQPYDRMWFRALHRVCHHRGLTSYGVYTVTRTGARPVSIDDAA